MRQILFNELGLSREYVRDLIREIVSKTTESFFASQMFEKFLREEIDKQLRSYHYGSQELKTQIATAVGETIRREVTSKLTLQISGNFNGQPQS